MFVFVQIQSGSSRCICYPFIHVSELMSVGTLKAAEHATFIAAGRSTACAPYSLGPDYHWVQPEDLRARMQGAPACIVHRRVLQLIIRNLAPMPVDGQPYRLEWHIAELDRTHIPGRGACKMCNAGSTGDGQSAHRWTRRIATTQFALQCWDGTRRCIVQA